MSNLFSAQNKVTHEDCEAVARMLTNSTVAAVSWQGSHSYTLRTSSNKIVQFRSNASPASRSAVQLAKIIHGRLVPTTEYHGFMPDSSITVWLMEILRGTAYLFTVSHFTPDQKDVTIVDLAKFFARSWKNPRPRTDDRMHLYQTKLEQLLHALPAHFTPIIEQLRNVIAGAMNQVPWVLTHKDLSNLNILVDEYSGNITGIVDWTDATVEPFGMALWGVDSVINCGGGSDNYFEDDSSHTRSLFRETFLKEIKTPLSNRTLRAMEHLRSLGVLLRYGFKWEDGAEKPVDDTFMLEMVLEKGIFC